MVDCQHIKSSWRKNQRSREITDKKKEKYGAKKEFLQNTSTDSKRVTFVIWKNHTSAPIRTKRLSRTSKARRETSRNRFVKKDRVPDSVENFGEVDSSENCFLSPTWACQTHQK